MKFVKNLYVLIEGIGSTINFDPFKMKSFKIKDKKFLKYIDFIYLLKKTSYYINEEVEKYNKLFPDNEKSKIELDIQYVDDFSNDDLDIKDELKNHINDLLISDKINIHQFKIDFIKLIVKLNKIFYSKIRKYENFLINLDDFFKSFNIILTIKKDDKKFKEVFRLGDELNFNFNLIIHDIVSHNFLNQKDMFSFNKFELGYRGYNPYKYSPESILNELYVSNVDNIIIPYFYDNIRELQRLLIKDLKKLFDSGQIKKIEDSFKPFPETLKEIKIYLEQGWSFDIEKNFNNVKKIVEQNPKLYINSYSFLKSKKAIKRDRENIYNFFKYVNESIKYHIKEHPTWKHFREYFKDYPAIQKLFNSNKYPDNKLISSISSFEELNEIIYKAVKAGQNLMKRKTDSDLYNRQNVIEFLVDKIYKFINNTHFTDNKKYYDMLDKKIEDEK